jgi:hypothetical protein
MAVPEQLEQRQLMAVVAAGDEHRVLAGASPSQLVVIDASLASYGGIAASFGSDARVLFESATTDLFAEVSAALAADPGVSSIHLVSHGTPGRFSLGSATFDPSSVDEIGGALVAWNRLAAPGADLYLWGCNIAGGDGASLIDTIHTLSGFGVAASTDVTGPAALGGDFDLEYTAGDVTAPQLVSGVDVLWDTTLAVPTDYSFTTSAVKAAVNAVFTRLENTVAPAVQTALASQTNAATTDQFSQRTVSDLFTGSGSISPTDIRGLMSLATTASTYLGGATPTLSGLAATLQSGLGTRATTAGASAPTITVTPTITRVSGAATKLELAVSIDAKGTTTTAVDRGTQASPTVWGGVLGGLNTDLSLSFRTDPQLETGSRLTAGFTISIDLADADNPVASIAFSGITLTAGLFGFGATPIRIGALDASMTGTTAPALSTTVTFGGGASRTVSAWETVGSVSASALAASPAITVDMPVTASLGGTAVSSATTKITVQAANVFATTKPAVSLVDFNKLVWFGSISSDDIISAVLAAGGAYDAIAAVDGGPLSPSVPFASKQTLGSVFNFGGLFNDAIGSQIDVSVDKTVNGTTTKVRPDDLRTFADFATKFPGLGITPVYDAAAGTVALDFSASRTNTPSVTPAVGFAISPLGSLDFTGGKAAAFSAPVELGFGVRFDVSPSAAIVLGLPSAAKASGKLSEDAVFTVTPAFGAATTVTVSKGSTDDNASTDDLLADVNAALAGTSLLARKSDFGVGLELYTPTVSASMPTAITITASRSAGSRDLGFSDALPNDAKTPYQLFARASAAGSKVVPHESKSFGSGSFTWSLDDLSGQVGYGLNTIGFTDTAGSVTASLSLALPAAGTDADTLGTDPDTVLTTTLTDDASLTLTGLSRIGGTSDIKPGSQIVIGVPDFSVETVDVFSPLGVPLQVANLESDGRVTGRLSADAAIRFIWGSQIYEATVTTAEAAGNASFDDLVGDFNVALTRVRRVVNDVAGGDPADVSGSFSITGAAGRLTVLRTTETPAAAVLTGKLVPNLAAGGAITGRLADDASLMVVLGAATYTVTVTRSATLDNTSFADLVADFNAAVATASRAQGDVTDTVDASDVLQFAASGKNIQPLSPASIVNPNYAVVTLPPRADLGEIGYQASLTAGSVATALRQASGVFTMLGRDLKAYTETELPLLNAPLDDFIALDTGFAARVETLRGVSVTSIGGLERAIETTLGLSASDLVISFDAERKAYRIDLAYHTSVSKKVGFDLNLESYYDELGRLMPQGINELVDADGKTPLTVVLDATSVLSVGIDLATSQTFLYGFDGGSTRGVGDGTSFQIDVNVNGKSLAFPARFGMFVKGGTAKIEDGGLVVTLSGPAGTPASSAYYVQPGAGQLAALDVANYAAAFKGKVEVVMPIFDEFTPATLTAASAAEAAKYDALKKSPASLYLGIASLGDYERIRGQIDDAKAALLQLRQTQLASTGGMTLAQWQAVLDQNSDLLPDALKVFAPELDNAKSIVGADATLIDMIRDPAIILDTLDTVLRQAENAMKGIGDLDLPLVGNSLGNAVDGLFGFRRGWLLDMRQKLRGAGESVIDVMRQEIFDTLGPKGAGILLVNNGLRSAEGMVAATKSADIGLDFLDKNGKKVANGVRGADAFEITIRLGQQLFDTGVDLGFQFDALAPMIQLGLDGGLRLQMGWDIQLGFGFSMENGPYIKLDPDSPEAQVRFDATLTGKSAQYRQEWDAGGQYWKIVDGNGQAVIDPISGQPYHALAVDKKGVDVTASVPLPGSPAAVAQDPCGCGDTPTKTESGAQVWWVVAAKNGVGNWRPAELNDEMRYVAQSAIDASSMIEVKAMAPASLSGSLAFLRLTATDMVRRGLTGVTDYDNTYSFDASGGPQTDASARDDKDKGVNRNNQLATMFSGVIGIDIVDPSANKSTFKAVPDKDILPDGLKLADSKGQAILEKDGFLGLTGTPRPVPVRQFYEFKLRQGPGADYHPLDLSVRVATTSNIQLAGIGIVDGVQLKVGDRVLVKNQVNAEENGVYVVSARGWSRSFDTDTNDVWNEGKSLFVFVDDGRTNKTTGWAVDPRVGTVALGTTSIIFTRVETVGDGATLVPYEPFKTLLLPANIVDKPLKDPLTIAIAYDGVDFLVTLPATESTGVVNRAVQLSHALGKAVEDKNGNQKKDSGEREFNLLQAGFAFPIPPKGNKTEAKYYVVERPARLIDSMPKGTDPTEANLALKSPQIGTRVIYPVEALIDMNSDAIIGSWEPVRDINADASKNRLTFAEMRSGGLGIFKVDVSATAVANFQLTLSVGDSVAFPKIFADLNIDWSTKSARAKIEIAKQQIQDAVDSGTPAEDDYGDSLRALFAEEDNTGKTATTGADKGIDPNSPLAKEMDLLPEIGLSNVRLDLGSFLTQFVKPIVDEADPYLEKIRPVLDFLTAKVPVLSDIAGTDIRVVDLIEKFGGEKAKGVRSVVDAVSAIDALVARIASLPSGVNVQLPLGRFWFPKEANKDIGKYSYASFRYDNVALGVNVDRSKADAAANAALDALTELKKQNPDSPDAANKQKGIKSASDRGGFRVPVLENPLTAFKMMMGEDVPLFTFQLPKLQYQLDKSVPLARIVCFEVGLKMGFEMKANLAFGFDTYGFKLYGQSHDPLDVAQGFYVSDRANADGTGADVPEFQTTVSFGLYGGIDVLFAKAGIEGGVRVTADVNLNDPNDDGKLRLTEALGLVVDTGNPLDLFDFGLRGEIYAKYYYDVFGLISGGADFARITLFDLEHEGSDGTPLYGNVITSEDSDGTQRPGTLMLNVGDNAAKRVSNQDPLHAKDGAERFQIWNSGSTVFVKYLNYSDSKVRTYENVERVVFDGGIGDDSLDASGLSGLPLLFDGGDGNDTVILGSGSGSAASRLDGGDGKDAITVVGGGVVVIDGGLGDDTIIGGAGTVWIDAGAGSDTVTSRDGSTTTIHFTDQFGQDQLTLATAAAMNLLDFGGIYSSIAATLFGVNGLALAGSANFVAFNLTGLTEIRGTSSPDTFTVRNPTTRNANGGKGLVIRGGLGDDAYDFTVDDASGIASDGILVDDVQPVTAASAGGVKLCGMCNAIESIAVADSGSGYTSAPDVVIDDPTGYGAKATATIDDSGRVISINVIAEGQGYTNPKVYLVNPVSYADKLTFSSVRPEAALSRSGTTYALGIDGKAVRFIGWDGVGSLRPKGFDKSEIDSVTVSLPEGVFTLASSIDLFDTFTVNASRMVQNARVVADTIGITTDHGFQVRYALDTTNSGDVKIRVTGDGSNTGEGDINGAANQARGTANVAGGAVSGVTLANAGKYYFFDPSIAVGSTNTSAGTGARFTATRTGSSLAGFTQLSGGGGYFSSPAPIVVVPPPASIQVDAMITSSSPGGIAGLGDGRGRVVLYADTGMISTSGEVFFPTDTTPGSAQGSRVIDWIDGDFRYRTRTALDDLVSPSTYPGISVGTGAEFTAVLDADGRVTSFTQVSGGRGYSKDLPPEVEVEGLATATAIVGDDGSIAGLRVTYPGDGYGQPPKVTIRPNGFGRIVNSPSGTTASADGTPMNRVHIRSIGGTLVAVAGAGVGDPLKPLKSDVETFVSQVKGGGVHLLEKDGLRIGKDGSIAGIATVNGDVSIATFGGAIELGAPKQSLDDQGRPLWQDAAKTIPIYDRDPVTGKIIYEGGQVAVGSGNVKLTADDIEVNVDLNKSGGSGTIELQPVKVIAEIGLSGTRARTQAVVENGRLVGFDATKFWSGRGYTTAPLVIVDPAGQRAFATAVVQDGQVTAIDVVYGGTNYSADDPPVITLTGGRLEGAPASPATATAIVGPGGAITGFTITNGGSGYAFAPGVSIASPGQALVQAVLDTAPPDPVTGRFAVKQFVVTNPGRNYTTAPNIEVAAPYDFTLDADEIAMFDTAFEQVVIGRIEGQHLFHSPEASFGSGVVLRAPRGNSALDVGALVASGPVSIVGSGHTFHLDAAGPTVSGTSISIDDNVIVHTDVAAAITATTDGIDIFGSAKGMIDGDGGTNEDLVLAAETSVSVTGAIGSRDKLDDLTINSLTRAAISLEQSVTVAGNLGISGGDVTVGGVVDVGGNLVVDASGMVMFAADVTIVGDLTIIGATGVTFAGLLNVTGTVTIVTSSGAVRFQGMATTGGAVSVTSPLSIELSVGFDAAADVTFTSDSVDFKGGAASVVGVAGSTLTVQPFTASRPIRVGSPTGSTTGTLDVSDSDLAAIAGGWGRLVIGDAASGTGAVTVGSIGTRQGSKISRLASATTIVGGSVTVAQKVDVAATAGMFKLVARTGDVTVNAAINETAAERNPWVFIQADKAIAIKAPVSSTATVSLVSGTTTSQAAAGPLATGGLRVSSGGAVSLEASGNAFDTLAVKTTDDAISIREDSGCSIGTVDGVSGIDVGSAAATLVTSGTVTQTQPIDAATLVLQGKGGQWTLTGANTIGMLSTDTGRLAVADAAGLTLGKIAASAATGTAVSIAAPSGISLTDTITTLGGDVVFENAVTLTGDIVLTTASGGDVGSVRFKSTVDGTTSGVESLSITGNLVTLASVGVTTALESLSVSGASDLAGGMTVRTVGNQTYTGSATSAGVVTVRAGAGSAVKFQGDATLGGLVTTGESYDVSLTGSKVTITDAVAFLNTGVVTLGDGSGDVLTFNGGLTSTAPSVTNLAGTIGTSNDAATFGKAFVTASTTVSTGAAGTTFSSAVDGGQSLAVNTSGTTTFSGAVGGTTALTSLTTDKGGTTAVNGGSVKTSGVAGQVYNDAVALGANTVLDAASGAITFATTLDGAFTLAANTTGATTFGGAVGGATPLAHLETNAGGTTLINGGSITTGSPTSQVYNDAVVLGANTVLAALSGGITFASTLDGGYTLAVNTTGTTTFGGAVGGTTALTSLTTNKGGTTSINGGSVKTSGVQQYNDAVTLGANTSFGGSGVAFGSTLQGAAETLSIAAGATGVSFGGNVGTSPGPLGAIDVASVGVVTISGDISSTGPVTIRSTGGGITMADGAVVDAGVGTILLGAAGDIGLGGLVTTNATSDAVKITSTGGAIVDGGDTDTDIVAAASGAVVTLKAATGIGASNSLEIKASSVGATTTAGGIGLSGVGDLSIGAGGLTAPGVVALSATGSILVPSGGRIAGGSVTANKPILWSVLNTADSGAGSLRQLIANANATGVEGVVVLTTKAAIFTPITPLPTITTRFTLDGTGSSIVLDGGSKAAVGLSLAAGSGGSTIRGLTVRNFTGTGIVLDTTAGTAVSGCVIQANGNGLSATGDLSTATVVGNTFTRNRLYGIQLTAARGLWIDGNTVTGVNTAASMGLYATGNLAGTRITGNSFSGGLRGALLDNARNLVFGEAGRGNSLSNNRAAPGTAFAGTGIRAQGNLVGTTIRGNTFTGNNYAMAFINAQNLLFGGRKVGEGNTINNSSIAALFVEGNNAGSAQVGTVLGAGTKANAKAIQRVQGAKGV